MAGLSNSWFSLEVICWARTRCARARGAPERAGRWADGRLRAGPQWKAEGAEHWPGRLEGFVEEGGV